MICSSSSSALPVSATCWRSCVPNGHTDWCSKQTCHLSQYDTLRPNTLRIPRGFSDELRNQADIVRIVSDYVSLKKKGRDWAACCPFHNEKTPSFYVSQSKQIFKCFGCSKGGSVFDFVMEIEGCSFPEAI